MTVKNNTNTTYTFRNPTTDKTTAIHNEYSTKPKELENPKTEIVFGNLQQHGICLENLQEITSQVKNHNHIKFNLQKGKALDQKPT